MQKKGKLPAEMRYKMILKRKQEEAREKAMKATSALDESGRMVATRKMTPKAEQALKEMAMKKAAKEQKKLRKMVIVQPQNFSNGRIDKKGQIFDIAGNMVGKVNTKNGSMTLTSGWGIGRYKPKSYMTKLLIEQAIDKHSPYFIQLRRQQQMAQAMNNVYGGMSDPNVMSVYGSSAQAAMLGGGMYGNVGRNVNVHGVAEDDHLQLPPQSNVTSLGAMSNNVHGTFMNGVHGTMMDNVHGTVNTDVWGAAGGGSMWGSHGVRMYGTGSGVNYLSGLTKYILALFGFKSKQARQLAKAHRAAVMASRGSGGSRSVAARRR